MSTVIYLVRRTDGTGILDARGWVNTMRGAIDVLKASAEGTDWATDVVGSTDTENNCGGTTVKATWTTDKFVHVAPASS